MAEKITINLPGPDGVSIPVDMPAWALEETQLKLLAAADSNKNYNEDSKKALEKLVGIEVGCDAAVVVVVVGDDGVSKSAKGSYCPL